MIIYIAVLRYYGNGKKNAANKINQLLFESQRRGQFSLLRRKAPIARCVVSWLFVGRFLEAELSEALESSSKVIAQSLVSLNYRGKSGNSRVRGHHESQT